MRRKTRRNVRRIGSLVTMSTIPGLIGSNMPGTTGAALTSASSAAAPFVGPAVNVFGAGLVLDAVEELNPKRKRQRRRLM